MAVFLHPLCLAWLAFLAPAPADVAADGKPVVVPFELLATKHMAIMIRINGKGPYRVIFDTGAPISLINTRIAKDSGLMAKDAAKPFFPLMAAGEAKIKELRIGNLKAENVNAIIMDHPTVEMASQFLGPLDGIIGFPFFARYKMTLDYQTKQLTFLPSDYKPGDVMQEMMASMMGGGKSPRAVRSKVLAPAGLWGMVVAKEAGDEEAGVVVKDVLAGGAADKAGLRVGDRLLSLDGRWTDSVADCYRAAGGISPGTTVKAQCKRNGEYREIAVTPVKGL